MKSTANIPMNTPENQKIPMTADVPVRLGLGGPRIGRVTSAVLEDGNLHVEMELDQELLSDG